MAKTLENEIDLSMRRLVALFNLSGIKTYWCCSGFTYKNETNYIDKRSHVIGQPQVWIEANEKSFNFLMKIIDLETFGATGEWNAVLKKMAYQPPMFVVLCHFRTPTGLWDSNNDAHYHERMNTSILRLEQQIIEHFKDDMAETVVIKDNNRDLIDLMPGWDIEPAEDWVVSKSDYIKVL